MLVVTPLHALAQRGDIEPERVADAIVGYGIDADAADPRLA